MNDLQKIIISCSIEQARNEGLAEEEAIANRANEIALDANLEDPQTPQGDMIRIKALKIFEEQKKGIESPYIPKVVFDVGAIYDKTAVISVPEVFSKIAELCAPLVLTSAKPSLELIKLRQKTMDDLSIEVFKILNKNKVVLCHYDLFFKSLKEIVNDLNQVIKDQIEGHSKEILSRTIGIRHPNLKDNTFKSEWATYEDLLKAREETIKRTGGKNEDYFRSNFEG